jgi:hypothetical protein
MAFIQREYTKDPVEVTLLKTLQGLVLIIHVQCISLFFNIQVACGQWVSTTVCFDLEFS